MREEEAQLARLKTERTAAAKQFAPRVLPHPAAIAGYARNLFALLETDPVRGREILARFVAPVVMTPEVAPSAQTSAQGDGPPRRYRATGAFNLSFFLTGALNDRSGKSSCAGRI